MAGTNEKSIFVTAMPTNTPQGIELYISLGH